MHHSIKPEKLAPPTEIPEARNKIYGRLWSRGISYEVKLWADRNLEPIQSDLDQICRGSEGYLDFLATHISREYERLQADADDPHPYDSLRETPLCTCRDFGCRLKEGTLPVEIRDADDLDRAIREFVLDHAGDPLVLDYDGEPPGASQAWSRKIAKVWSVLRTIEMFSEDGQEEPPTADQLTNSPYVDPLPEDAPEKYAADKAADKAADRV